MPMNDPHVKALHYFIKHDNSVDYSDVEPLVHDDPLFRIRAKQRNVVLEPKCHYATEEKARRAAEGFVRRWEFEAALRTQSGAFRLEYQRARVIDRDPPPSPSGGVNAGPISWSFHLSEPQVTVTKKLATYPVLPSDPAITPDDRDPLAMLYRLDLYRMGREPLASMAYFCLTVLEDSTKKAVGGGGSRRDRRARGARYYGIAECVLDKVGDLSSEKGDDVARKAEGRGDPFTSGEIRFLEAAVTAFIRRTAEKAADPKGQLRVIGMADLPKLP